MNLLRLDSRFTGVTGLCNRFIVDFSARATEYDVMVTHGVQVPTPDKEHINIHYFDQMTNEDLDELRRILGSQ